MTYEEKVGMIKKEYELVMKLSERFSDVGNMGLAENYRTQGNALKWALEVLECSDITE